MVIDRAPEENDNNYNSISRTEADTWHFKTKAETETELQYQERQTLKHWRRQLWGTGARAPLDFQLVILGITRFTDSDESCARFSVQ